MTRGLFERHRLIFSLQLACRILVQAKQLNPELVDQLVRNPKQVVENPCNGWLTDSAWQSAVGLSRLEQFANLPNDLEASAKKWKEWCDHPQAELEQLPLLLPTSYFPLPTSYFLLAIGATTRRPSSSSCRRSGSGWAPSTSCSSCVRYAPTV